MSKDNDERMTDAEIDRLVRFVQTKEAEHLGDECKRLKKQLAAAKELLREVLTENARMGNDVVLLTKKWRERAKEVTETPDR